MTGLDEESSAQASGNRLRATTPFRFVTWAFGGILGGFVFFVLGLWFSTSSQGPPEWLVGRPLAPVTSYDEVRLEADLVATNLTAGDDEWLDAVSADVGDQLQFQGWYYNMENVTPDRPAYRLAAAFDLPATRGDDKAVRLIVQAVNSNRVVTSAPVTLPDGAVLQYVHGTARWRHKASNDDNTDDWVTESVGDAIVDGGVTLEDASSCLMCEATVTIVARVVEG